MKTIGIILLVLGGLAVLGAISQAMQGRDANLGGLTFVVLGAFLIHRANKKKEEREERGKWINGDDKDI